MSSGEHGVAPKLTIGEANEGPSGSVTRMRYRVAGLVANSSAAASVGHVL